MSEALFDDIDKQLFKLYETKEFAKVLALAEQEQPNFPNHLLACFYWRICMTSLLGKQGEALQLFRAALDQGLWFAPDWLVEDEDLVALRPFPEFQELVEVCRQRLAEAQASVHPELLVFLPDQQSTTSPLLMVLHGNMGNARYASEKWQGITERG